jgi:glyceraldehyde 3-phosphate dehydrogenase
MAIKIAINGFGRMGRLAARALWGHPEVELVHVNEIGGDAACAAHLLYFDSVHGRWDRECSGEGAQMVVDGKNISYSSCKNPADVPWADLGVDIVMDATGKHRTPETLAPYFAAGVKKVVVAAPVKTDAVNIVMGVNEHEYDPQKHRVVTAASCTTNCLAPIVKVIHENLGIKHGMITTIHDMTNTQSILDTPHKDLRRARASSMSLIPTSTGSATAIGMIFPELLGRLDGVAVRVPLLNASLTDCTFELSRATTVEEVNGLLKAAADGSLQGILGYEERPLVSVDYVNDPRSSIIDALSTMVTQGTQVKILSWYDNEWGYANRYAELTRKVAAMF